MNSSPSVNVRQEKFSGDLLSELSTSLKIFKRAEDEYEDVELKSSELLNASHHFSVLYWYRDLASIHTYDAKRNLEAISREYTAILSICLQPYSFGQPTEYEDTYGGHVIDFYRDYDRITGIISEAEVQILSNLNDEIKSKVFSRTNSTKLDVLEYIEKLFE